MGNFKVIDEGNGMYAFYCPGCKHSHAYYTKHFPGHESPKPVWGFNGNMDSPTFTPSLLNRSGTYADPNWRSDTEENTRKFSSQCHLFVRDGKIEYCGDCTHELKGQTIDMNHV
jgi:hypothetical protein